jgi:hypothetical protein
LYRPAKPLFEDGDFAGRRPRLSLHAPAALPATKRDRRSLAGIEYDDFTKLLWKSPVSGLGYHHSINASVLADIGKYVTLS